MMGMTGILLLIAELIFDVNVLPAKFVYHYLLILIPVLVSPWETQWSVSRKKGNR